MAWIWTMMLGCAILGALYTGQTAALSAAALEGAKAAVSLAVTLCGPLCLWSGVAHVAQTTGAADKLSRLTAPLLRRLFPLAWRDPQTRDALSGNFSANLLGLGNAATPLGIQAVRRMHTGGSASDELCRLIVLNTASVQLIPTTVAALRAGLGAPSPLDILPAVWLTSLGSVTVGLLAAKAGSRWL